MLLCCTSLTDLPTVWTVLDFDLDWYFCFQAHEHLTLVYYNVIILILRLLFLNLHWIFVTRIFFFFSFIQLSFITNHFWKEFSIDCLNTFLFWEGGVYPEGFIYTFLIYHFFNHFSGFFHPSGCRSSNET